MVWVSRIMAIGLAMFLPGVAGGWLDGRLGTRFLGLAGLALGFSVAIVWLVQVQRRRGVGAEGGMAGRGRWAESWRSSPYGRRD